MTLVLYYDEVLSGKMQVTNELETIIIVESDNELLLVINKVAIMVTEENVACRFIYKFR